jgi:hypothetical protein
MILKSGVTSELFSVRGRGNEAVGVWPSACGLFHPFTLFPLLLHHLAQAASLGLATQLALGDEPSFLAVGAEDLVLGHHPAKPLEKLFLALTRSKRNPRQP